MTHFVPCTTQVSARQLATLFLDSIFKIHGLPEEIISDRDPRFTSHFWQELCRHLGTRQNLSSPYHPQSDGQTERMNRILEEMLRHFVAPHQQDWDLHLTTCEFAINNAVQESTGYSPFYLTYGYHPLTPGTAITPGKVPAAAELHEQLKTDLKQAKLHLEAAQKRQKYYHDTTRRHVTYHEEERVLLSTDKIGLKKIGTPKLLPKYIGPFRVLKRIGELAYRLELPPTLKIHNVFHVSRLKKFRDDGRVQPPPQPITVDGQTFMEPELVYHHRDIKRGPSVIREYLVRWKGHGVEHDEYIPATCFSQEHLPILRKYWAKLQISA
jgi:hypothetical protein